MSSAPLVSAIIPTYNRAYIVCEAIDSVLAQTYSNVEVIVVDDGSKDDTLDKLKAYGSRIRVIAQPNGGPAVARNTGIAAAKGDLIAFLDSDDLWLPSKLERQVELLEKSGEHVPCCLSNILMRWKDSEFTSFHIAWLDPEMASGLWLNADEVLTTRFVLFNQGIVIRRKVLEKIGGFDAGLKFGDDQDLPLRLSLEGPWAFVKEPLVVWRETEASWYKQSKREDLLQKDCLVQVFEKLLARIRNQTGRERLKRYITWELQRAKRQLSAARIGQMGFRGAELIGRSLDTLERLRHGVYRRSPRFPRMQVRAVE